MEDIVVLRVEVSDVGTTDETSLNSKKFNAGTSLAAGAVGGVAASIKGGFNDKLSSIDSLISNKRASDSIGMAEKRAYALKRLRGALTAPGKNAGITIFTPGERIGAIGESSLAYMRNVPLPSWKQVSRGMTGISTSVVAAYSLYSNYQQAGLEMAGATHAAAIRARKTGAANFGVSVGLAAVINPVLAAPMIGMKAWQLAQTNRKEIYEIQKNQIQSQILQRNLVKTVAERRF